MSMIQNVVKATVWVLLRFLYRVKVRGGHNIPREGGALLVPNHVSFIDAVLIAAHIARPIRYAMHWSLYRRFRWIVAPMGAFPIAGKSESSAVYARAFEIMGETLRRGGLVCIFPEGMITLTGEMNPFRNGILKVIEKNPVPIIPVGLRGLWGSYFSKKKPGMFKLPDHFMAKIEMVVGKPLPATTPLAEIESHVRELSNMEKTITV